LTNREPAAPNPKGGGGGYATLALYIWGKYSPSRRFLHHPAATGAATNGAPALAARVKTPRPPLFNREPFNREPREIREKPTRRRPQRRSLREASAGCATRGFACPRAASARAERGGLTPLSKAGARSRAPYRGTAARKTCEIGTNI
jgi:hypothetical protein